MIQSKRSCSIDVFIETIQEESDKCVFRCANCHQIKMVHENGYWILEHIE